MNCNNNVIFGILVAITFILLFCYCNQRVDKLKNETFYEPKLKLNIPTEPKLI